MKLLTYCNPQIIPVTIHKTLQTYPYPNSSIYCISCNSPLNVQYASTYVQYT